MGWAPRLERALPRGGIGYLAILLEGGALGLWWLSDPSPARVAGLALAPLVVWLALGLRADGDEGENADVVVEEFPGRYDWLRVEENWVRIWRISTVLILLALGDAAWSAWTWGRPPATPARGGGGSQEKTSSRYGGGDAMKRALLVIDVQNEYFTGALPVTHPIGHLGKILRAMDAASGSATPTPTVVIRHAFPDPTTPFFLKGSHGWQLHPEVEARPRSHLVDKELPGSFTGTDLEAWLRAQDVDTVTIVGYMTHMCCDTTARQAMHLGLKVEFLSDATGTLPVRNEAGEVTAEELHRAILCAQQMMISEVLDTEAWVGRVEGA